MNTKIILGLGSSLLLASALLANSPQSDMKLDDGCSCKKKQEMKHHKKAHPEKGMVKMFMQLDLSDAQRAEIHSIIKESMKTRVSPSSAFSDTSFIKEEFVKIIKEERDNEIERRAQMIEKIYNTLAPSQKKDFKTILDMREIMKKNHQKAKCFR